MTSEAAKMNSAIKSLSETASMLLAVKVLKPRRRATQRRSRGSPVPARAADPSGITCPLFRHARGGARPYLILPPPARVGLAACVADPADQGLFDGHVDVLVVWRKDKFPRPDLGENRPEAGADLPCLGRRDDPLPGKHAGMGDAPFNVVAVEAPVVMGRWGKCLHPPL